MIQFTGKDEYFFFIPENSTGIETENGVKSIADFATESGSYVENNIIVFPTSELETLTFIVGGQKIHNGICVRPLVNIIPI